MFRPLFHLATRQPQLLADHVEAYADLVSSELRVATALCKRRFVLRVAGAAALAVAVLLAGVALMFWAVLPTASMPAPWLLWLVPLVPAVGGVACGWLAGPDAAGPNFALLRRQWAADRAMRRHCTRCCQAGCPRARCSVTRGSKARWRAAAASATSR